jgi:site-specific recombinase XerD
VTALNLVEQLLAAKPVQQDSIDLWFGQPIARRLHAAGVATLHDLVATINMRGRRWWRRTGIGERRGARIVHWLLSQQDALGADIRPSIHEAMAKRDEVMPARHEIILPPRFAVVPMDRLGVPPHLSGTDGVFRAHGPNTLGASNDVQAIEAWLERHRERAGTWRGYRKEVERFLLWCLLELRKPVSSVTSPDCQSFRAFLRDVPASWVNVVPVPRTDPMWRPFRGQPSPATQKQALVIVQCMFEGLMDAGYLSANAMRSVMKTFNLPTARLQVQRSFSEAEMRHVRLMIDAEPVGPLQRRLRLLIELLLATGIRLDELAQTTRDDLRQVEVDGENELAWMLTVLGKRRKLREVPVPNSVIELLRAHAADVDVPEAQARPLIAALGPGPGGNGALGAPMSASGLYAALKRFLGRVRGRRPRRGSMWSTWLRRRRIGCAIASDVGLLRPGCPSR